MLTAGAGRLVSPFANDPFALVALAFKNLYPEREYAAYFVPEVEDGSGGAACGVTTFPEDGSPPVVEVSGEIPIAAGVRAYQGITEKAAQHDGAAYPLYIIYKKGRVQNDGI